MALKSPAAVLLPSISERRIYVNFNSLFALMPMA